MSSRHLLLVLWDYLRGVGSQALECAYPCTALLVWRKPCAMGGHHYKEVPHPPPPCFGPFGTFLSEFIWSLDLKDSR
jgi:hypothetical protein